MKIPYKQKDKDRIVQEVCDKIAEEGRSLTSVLKDKKTYPARSTFNLWLKESDNYAHAYGLAIDQRADLIFDELLQIADNSGDDMIELPDGRQVVNHEVIHRDRLRVDTRKWILAKMQPAKYGDRVKIDTGLNENIKPIVLIDATQEETKKLKE